MYARKLVSAVLVSLIGAFWNTESAWASEPLANHPVRAPLTDELRASLLPYFTDLCDWIMTLDVGSGTLKNTEDTNWSIFIQGNFARVLRAGYLITGREAYLKEAIRWCDTFVGQQQTTVSSTGEKVGYWGDHGTTGNLYLSDAATASTALALGSKHVDPARRQRYLTALELYAKFIRQGSREDPQRKRREASTGWVIRSGKDRGAIGCGYYSGHLSIKPYQIASGIVGGLFHATFYSIRKDDPELARISTDAVRWLLTLRHPDGYLLYVLDKDPPRFRDPYCTLTYCGEGFIAAHTHIEDTALRQEIAAGLKPCIQWLLRTQNADGSWGEMRSFDQQRSPGVVTLLTWYYRTVDPDPQVAEAVQKYCRFLLDPDCAKKYGVKELVRTTGFAAMALAELIKPGVAFR